MIIAENSTAHAHLAWPHEAPGSHRNEQHRGLLMGTKMPFGARKQTAKRRHCASTDKTCPEEGNPHGKRGRQASDEDGMS